MEVGRFRGSGGYGGGLGFGGSGGFGGGLGEDLGEILASFEGWMKVAMSLSGKLIGKMGLRWLLVMVVTLACKLVLVHLVDLTRLRELFGRWVCRSRLRHLFGDSLLVDFLPKI